MCARAASTVRASQTGAGRFRVTVMHCPARVHVTTVTASASQGTGWRPPGSAAAARSTSTVRATTSSTSARATARRPRARRARRPARAIAGLCRSEAWSPDTRAHIKHNVVKQRLLHQHTTKSSRADGNAHTRGGAGPAPRAPGDDEPPWARNPQGCGGAWAWARRGSRARYTG